MDHTNVFEPIDRRIPSGNAKRIRFFLIICELLLTKESIDKDLFISELINKVKNSKFHFEAYRRKTGNITNILVANTYLKYCNWIGLINIEGNIINQNPYTIFFGTFRNNKKLMLSKEEKINIFVQLTKKKEFLRLLRSLKDLNNSASIGKGLETLLEWLIDLDIIYPKVTSIRLTETGSELIKVMNESKIKSKYVSRYASLILGKNVKRKSVIRETILLKIVNMSLQKLSIYTKSQFDQNVHSAIPILLDTQFKLVNYRRTFISFKKLRILIQTKLTTYFELQWNSVTRNGYLKTVVT